MNINLQLSPNANEFVKKNISYIQSWLNSAKFKQKQKEIESWQKYPPLIDPDAVNYAQTDPFLAYELNIPLPPFYDFLLLLSHGVGHNAFMRFFPPLPLLSLQNYTWGHACLTPCVVFVPRR